MFRICYKYVMVYIYIYGKLLIQGIYNVEQVKCKGYENFYFES